MCYLLCCIVIIASLFSKFAMGIQNTELFMTMIIFPRDNLWGKLNYISYIWTVEWTWGSQQVRKCLNLNSLSHACNWSRSYVYGPISRSIFSLLTFPFSLKSIIIVILNQTILNFKRQLNYAFFFLFLFWGGIKLCFLYFHNGYKLEYTNKTHFILQYECISGNMLSLGFHFLLSSSVSPKNDSFFLPSSVRPKSQGKKNDSFKIYWNIKYFSLSLAIASRNMTFSNVMKQYCARFKHYILRILGQSRFNHIKDFLYPSYIKEQTNIWPLMTY